MSLFRRFKVQAYSFSLLRLAPLLKRLGFLSGPRFWLPARVKRRVIRVPLMGGLGLEVMPGLNVSNTASSPIRYSWKTEVIEKLCAFKRGAFIDVGVHLGETLADVQFAEPGTHYIGFEPHAECVHFVRVMIRFNGFTNCTIYPCALADTSGLRMLHRRSLTDSEATLRGDLHPDFIYETVPVPVFRFDDIRSLMGPGNVAFVKIDVEGAELEVIRGMRRLIAEERPIMLCEVLFTHVNASLGATRERNASLLALLKEEGYEVWQLLKTENTLGLQSARRIDEFESAFYGPMNADLCDYLFVPSECSRAAVETLLSGR
jgi:FkbM family methyltransferase